MKAYKITYGTDSKVYVIADSISGAEEKFNRHHGHEANDYTISSIECIGEAIE